MGNKQAKQAEKKGKGDRKGKSKPKGKKGKDTKVKSTPNAKSPPAKKKGKNDKKQTGKKKDKKVVVGELASKDEMDPSWNDEQLFSKGGKVNKDDFELLMVVGKGSFGKVFQVKKKNEPEKGKIFAMKVLRKEAIFARKQVAHTKAEKTILSKIQHPFIIRMHWAFQTEQKLYMILDYINGGELFFHLKNDHRFSEDRVRLYVAEMALALSHLHSLDIVYRDLKPENILIDNQGHIVITDFGLSKEIDPGEGTQTFCGTPEYLAPEVLRGEGHGTAVDWWSLGTLMFEMLTGLPPFYSQNINIMYQKILTAELTFPSNTTISKDARKLLEGLLTRDPTKRLNAEQVKAHAFFKSIDWDKCYRREIEPPFKPSVKSEASTDNIDKVFTSEKAIDSVVEDSAIVDAAEGGGHLENFTFVAPSHMDG
eukprot:TRINITY_DN8329_c0_g1_i1.p1 TRINITY_DN8329_c0_g1~~TRINITY_DN8329_c0_g1_i1.p1  ORF type:complete len:424 (-),score=99.66 TRINITY_DN8329_c0_g1_i1:58-1329(-)